MHRTFTIVMSALMAAWFTLFVYFIVVVCAK